MHTCVAPPVHRHTWYMKTVQDARRLRMHLRCGPLALPAACLCSRPVRLRCAQPPRAVGRRPAHLVGSCGMPSPPPPAPVPLPPFYCSKAIEHAGLPGCSPQERRRLLSIVVVGGGPTGVEVRRARASLPGRRCTRTSRVGLYGQACLRQAGAPATAAGAGALGGGSWAAAPSAGSAASPASPAIRLERLKLDASNLRPWLGSMPCDDFAPFKNYPPPTHTHTHARTHHPIPPAHALTRRPPPRSMTCCTTTCRTCSPSSRQVGRRTSAALREALRAALREETFPPLPTHCRVFYSSTCLTSPEVHVS